MRRNHLFLHFPLSHWQYTKNFIDDSLHKHLLHLPLMLSVIGVILVLPVWYERTVREWFSNLFNCVRYVGFNFTELPKVTSFNTC